MHGREMTDQMYKEGQLYWQTRATRLEVRYWYGIVEFNVPLDTV